MSFAALRLNEGPSGPIGAVRSGAGAWQLGAMALAFVVLSGLLGPAAARSLTAQEQMGLRASVEAFQAAVKGSDYRSMVDAVPPKIVGELARQTKVPVTRWKASFAAMMREALEKTTILKFDMRLDRASVNTLHDGTVFVLVPTETLIVMNEVGRIQSEAATLALLEEGRWYLMRLNDPAQIKQLRLAYPAFGTVELPTASMKFLD